MFFTPNNNDNEYNLFGLYFYLSLSCVFCLILNSSFFLSNEKTSFLIIQLLLNSKDICISGLAFIMLKDNIFRFKKIIGLLISTIGAALIFSKSILDNLKIQRRRKKILYSNF